MTVDEQLNFHSGLSGRFAFEGRRRHLFLFGLQHGFQVFELHGIVFGFTDGSFVFEHG